MHPAIGGSSGVVISVPQQSHASSLVEPQVEQGHALVVLSHKALTVATKNKAIAIVQRETKIFFVFIFALILFNYVESFFLQYSRGGSSL
jgi:hypothetical protein